MTFEDIHGPDRIVWGPAKLAEVKSSADELVLLASFSPCNFIISSVLLPSKDFPFKFWQARRSSRNIEVTRISDTHDAFERHCQTVGLKNLAVLQDSGHV